MPECGWAHRKAGLGGRAGAGAQLSPGAVAGLQGTECRGGVDGLSPGVEVCGRGCRQIRCVPGITGSALQVVGQEGPVAHLHFCSGGALTLAEARAHLRSATESRQVHALRGPLILSLFERGAPSSVPLQHLWGAGRAQPPPTTLFGMLASGWPSLFRPTQQLIGRQTQIHLLAGSPSLQETRHLILCFITMRLCGVRGRGWPEL